MMIKRIYPALAALALLPACSSGDAADGDQPADGGERIACALSGAQKFTMDCAVERAEQDGKLTLLVRHPGGGFRRFEVLTDGRGLAAADGADDARVALNGNLLDVRVGLDRYRFPVTPKGHGTKPKS